MLKSYRSWLIAWIIGLSSYGPVSLATEPAWIKIDTTALTLMVYIGDEVRARFRNISIGRNGAARQRLAGDGSTPLGQFRISWINPQSQFQLFFGLDFPNLSYARQALDQGLIDTATYRNIRAAIDHQHLPPQNTPLGGYIGIHGIGQGNLNIHQTMNWTDGCVALSNHQITQLAKWIEIGTKVLIH